MLVLLWFFQTFGVAYMPITLGATKNSSCFFIDIFMEKCNFKN